MKHHILVKWNDKVTDRKKIQNDVEKLFAPLTEIPGIQQVEVIPNIVDRPNRYDLLIRITMQEAVLPHYEDSAIHKRWKAEYGDRIQSKAIFDSYE